jgi:hypothetical protein
MDAVMIRRRENGTYHCDGKDCGYPVGRFQGEDGECDEIVCPDCWSSMSVAPIKRAEENADVAV